jgi:8-oxo-dGTP diphosphatase / 2-hydroxy-dATP diphosphatase
MDMKRMTLAFLVRDGRMLLGLKKRGFAAGKWNGFGGKVGEGESAQEAAIRETREECGIEVTRLRKAGDVVFHNSDTEHHRVEIFSIEEYEGEPRESEEMRPQWFPLSEVPYESMWEDDRHWHPLFLAGKCFEGEFFFEDGRVVRTVLVERGPFEAVIEGVQ